MENSESTVNELKILFKWLVIFIAASVPIAAASIAYFSVLAANFSKDSFSTAPASRNCHSTLRRVITFKV